MLTISCGKEEVVLQWMRPSEVELMATYGGRVAGRSEVVFCSESDLQLVGPEAELRISCEASPPRHSPV